MQIKIAGSQVLKYEEQLSKHCIDLERLPTSYAELPNRTSKLLVSAPCGTQNELVEN